jgi:hypothetical protein
MEKMKKIRHTNNQLLIDEPILMVLLVRLTCLEATGDRTVLTHRSMHRGPGHLSLRSPIPWHSLPACSPISSIGV